MRVLITRPKEDATEFESLLRERGHEPVTEPLLSIVCDDGPAIDVEQYGLLVFTSANGVRAAARRVHARSTPVLAVGPATSAEARKAGFSSIATSTGEGTNGILEYLKAHPSLLSRPMLHISGTDVAGDLSSMVAGIGARLDRLQLYRAIAATSLSEGLREHLLNETLDAATFFSPRTAKIFSDLVRAAGLTATTGRMAACAISSNAANSLKTLTFRKVLVAQNATSLAMRDLLETL
jgi:uroporphyrinogen-III synthase